MSELFIGNSLQSEQQSHVIDKITVSAGLFQSIEMSTVSSHHRCRSLKYNEHLCDQNTHCYPLYPVEVMINFRVLRVRSLTKITNVKHCTQLTKCTSRHLLQVLRTLSFLCQLFMSL